jgi:predicted permease
MSVWKRLGYLLPWRRRAIDRDIQDELASLAAIADPGELGNLTLAAEDARDVWAWRALERAARDVRIGWRSLWRRPGFVVGCALSLALGIGTSTALFSVVYGTWLNAYPYDRAVEIIYPRARAIDGSFADSQNGVFRQREFLAFSRLSSVAETMANSFYDSVTIVGDNGPEIVPSIGLSAHAFQFLGVTPLHGRPLVPTDIRPGGDAEHVAVLSFKLWRRMFHGDPNVVGRVVALDDEPYVIVGVMPDRFGWGSASLPTNDALYVPLATTETNVRLRAWVRLRPGVSRDAAIQEFRALFTTLAAEPGSFPKGAFNTDFREFAAGTGETAHYVTQMRATLRFLIGGVAFLLLIACSNVANLQLARGSTRVRETAIRRAIGGSRASVFRQLLTESLMLALLGGLAGIALAAGLTRLIAALIPRGYVPSESAITMNLPVLLTGLAISIVSGVLFGIAPAIQGSTANLTDVLRDGGTTNSGRRGAHTRDILVVVQVALSVILLTGATLAIRGYVGLMPSDPGFNPDRLFVAPVMPRSTSVSASTRQPIAATNDFATSVNDLSATVMRVPSVEAATMFTYFRVHDLQIAGAPPRGDVRILMQAVGENYVRTLQIRIRAGRDFSDDEIAHGSPVALIDAQAAQLWIDGRNPLGSVLRINYAGPDRPLTDVTVVGIIGGPPSPDGRPMIYVPSTIADLPPASEPWWLDVRTRHAQPLQSVNVVRAQIFAANPRVILGEPVDMVESLSAGRLQPRFNVVLFGGMAAIALTLAAAGVFAVLSYRVAAQHRDIGIRLALGSGTGRIARAVLRKGTQLTLVGLAIGAAASVALNRLAQHQIDLIPKTDPVAIAMASAILAIVAAAACWLPARHACRINPVTVLRSD